MAQQIQLKNANDNNFFRFMISILWKNQYLCKQKPNDYVKGESKD
jgi:hypothetical protein